MENKKPTGLGMAGAILTIIGGAIFLISGIIILIGASGEAALLAIGIIFMIGSIASIISSSLYLKDKNKKVLAGVLSIFFGGILGGIFILVSE